MSWLVLMVVDGRDGRDGDRGCGGNDENHHGTGEDKAENEDDNDDFQNEWFAVTVPECWGKKVWVVPTQSFFCSSEYF